MERSPSAKKELRLAWCLVILMLPAFLGAEDAAADALAREVRSLGWIASAARSANGDWDIFVCRPDGSDRRNLTNSPDANEGYPLFSRDGKKLIWRRLKRGENFDGNRYGEQGDLVMADSDGAHAKSLGGEGDLPWASWSPDGKQFACLSVKGIAIVDVASGKTVRSLKRSGFFQQLTWSPDGRWFSGVSNSFGAAWSDARMNAQTGETNAVSRVDCCTPDWFPDSQRIIYSDRRLKQGNDRYGWTQLWMANGDGTGAQLVYAEDGRHLYGGHVSPDGRYVLFTGNAQEDGDPANAGAPMGLIRLADAPIVARADRDVQPREPAGAKSGPVLKLPAGWEPCWTFHEIFGSPR